MTIQITICGGGNAAHTLAGILGSQANISVRIYVPLDDEAERWTYGVQKNNGITVKTPVKTLQGLPEAICRDPKDAVTDSQIVLLALPAFAHEPVLRQIAPFIKPGTWVGAIPARGGFDLCTREVLKEDLADYTIFGFQTLPWACRIQTYGQQAIILGTKAQVDIAVWPQQQSLQVASILEEILGVKLNTVVDFLNLTLADTGQIIHPGIMHGLFHGWNEKPQTNPSLFYQGVNSEMAGTLQQMSDEIQSLRSGLEKSYPGLSLATVRPLREWLQRSYGANIVDNSSLQSCFATNRGYTGLLAPMMKVDGGYIPDFEARYLSEDVPYDLLVTRGIAELAGISTPVMDQVITWAQGCLEKEYLRDGKLQGSDISHTRSPQRYGFTQLNQFMREMHYFPHLS